MKYRVRLVTALAVTAACAIPSYSQVSWRGTWSVRGSTTFDGFTRPAQKVQWYEAQLPQQWVNTHKWDHAIHTPDRIKTIRPSGGDYTCNGATSVMQAALDEAESWRIAHDQDTRIDIDSSCPAFVVHGTATQLYLKNLDNAGSYDYDEAIVVRSLTPRSPAISTKERPQKKCRSTSSARPGYWPLATLSDFSRVTWSPMSQVATTNPARRYWRQQAFRSCSLHVTCISRLT